MRPQPSLSPQKTIIILIERLFHQILHFKEGQGYVYTDETYDGLSADISDSDIEYIIRFPLSSVISDDEEPPIIMLFGFDTIGRGLEVAYFTNENDEDMVIHAMKIRPSCNKYLYDRKGSM